MSKWLMRGHFGHLHFETFPKILRHLKARCFAFYCRALKLRESLRTPSSHFWECESHPHTCPKWGCDTSSDATIFCSTIVASNAATCGSTMWSDFCPSTSSSTRWLCLKAQMLPVKDECDCTSRCYIAFVVEIKYFAFYAHSQLNIDRYVYFLNSHIPNPRTLY
jgi:hypothetical protein